MEELLLLVEGECLLVRFEMEELPNFAFALNDRLG